MGYQDQTSQFRARIRLRTNKAMHSAELRLWEPLPQFTRRIRILLVLIFSQGANRYGKLRRHSSAIFGFGIQFATQIRGDANEKYGEAC